MNSTTLVRSRLERLKDKENFKDLAWIEEESVRPVSEEPARVTVHEALRLWRTRIQTARAPHRGMRELITHLEKLTPQKQVEQYAFDGANSTATYVFTRVGGKFLGSIVVEHRAKRPSPTLLSPCR